MTVVYIFRRDYRCYDNLGFIQSIRYARENNLNVLPIFCLDENQIQGKYFSNKAFQFISESLNDLNSQLNERLVVCKTKNVITFLRRRGISIELVLSNLDYTPYAVSRDAKLRRQCARHNIRCEFVEDYMLTPIKRNIRTSDDTPIKVFRYFYKKALMETPMRPQSVKYNEYIIGLPNFKNVDLREYFVKDEYLEGGRTKGLIRLREFNLDKYEKCRDILSENATSKLSAYIKFGCISIREVYWEKYKSEMFIRQLYWRDFYGYLTYHYPHVLEGMIKKKNENFIQKKVTINWENNDEWFKRWCDGQTGYPIVDAGMRELNTTGFMHNRARMITAMFLTKHLHIDWRKGERYFANKLTDYDPCSNNGGWQWCAGTGTDFKNYFRMFNPWTQTKKFDTNCEYIKKWVPELTPISTTHILKWFKYHSLYQQVYITPIVSHQIQRKKTLSSIFTA